MDALSLQKELVARAWPASFEKELGQYLLEVTSPMVDEVWMDRMGNVVCHKKGHGKKMLFAAHMDVLGLLALYIDDRGFLHFDTNGGFKASDLLSAPFVTESGVLGCVRPMGKVYPQSKELAGFRERDDLYMDIGVNNREEAECLIRPGMAVKYANTAVMLGNGIMVTPYADNLACCNAMILSMQMLTDKVPQNDCYFVFSSQEEIGERGISAAVCSVTPDIGIAVDGTYSRDSLSDDRRIGNKLGLGPCIKISDAFLCNRQVTEFLRDVAEQNHILYQDEIMFGGGTDGEMIQRANTGIPTGGISIAMRNIHSGLETVSIRDIETCAALISAAAMTKYTGGTYD